MGLCQSVYSSTPFSSRRQRIPPRVEERDTVTILARMPVELSVMAAYHQDLRRLEPFPASMSCRISYLDSCSYRHSAANNMGDPLLRTGRSQGANLA